MYVITTVWGEQICQLFGADQSATAMAVSAIPKYGWNFIFASMTTVISAYLYSTKRTKESSTVNIIRGFVFTPVCVVALSFIFKGSIVWFTIGIAEALSFTVAMLVMKNSEKNGIDFKESTSNP